MDISFIDECEYDKIVSKFYEDDCIDGLDELQEIIYLTQEVLERIEDSDTFNTTEIATLFNKLIVDMNVLLEQEVAEHFSA